MRIPTPREVLGALLDENVCLRAGGSPDRIPPKAIDAS